MRLVVTMAMARASLRISTQYSSTARQIAVVPVRPVGIVLDSGRSHMGERSTDLIAEREELAENLGREGVGLYSEKLAELTATGTAQL